MIVGKAIECQPFCKSSMPDDFGLEVLLAEDLIEHYLDVMAGVPIAMQIEAAGFFEYPRQFHAAGAHELDVGSRGFMAIFKGALLLRLAPENLVGPVGVKGRVDVDEVNAGVGQLSELLQIVTAVDDARVEK